MTDDTTPHKENPVPADTSDTGDVGTSSAPKKIAPRPRSSGRGLYITAIILGILIVLLLALYLFLALTYKKPAHSSIVPLPATIQISKS